MTYDVVCADVLEWAAEYEGEPFHAMLCDPPYEMGFMNKAFDKTGISFRSETWAALAEHLLPGGFIMAFSGARTYHRMAVAMEDAGLIMHPSIFGWAYGSGFPKSTKVERDSAASLFCQCENSQQLFPGCDLSHSGRDEMNTAQDSQGGYLGGRRVDGEQPLDVQDSAQGVAPLQDGVQEHNHSAVPLAEIQEDNEPSHNLCQVQYSDRHASTDCSHRVEPAPVLPQSQVSAGEKCRVDGSIHASKDDSVAQDQFGVDGVSGTVVDHIQHICSSGSVSSSKPPPVESRSHSTTEQKFCQDCGKLQRGIWQGHRYGLQAMKPALEPILLFQKPWEGKRLDCIVETGAGSLWVDGGRISADGANKRDGRKADGSKGGETFHGQEYDEREQLYVPAQGRWPANFCLTHVPPDADGNGGCVRDGVRRVIRQSGDVRGDEPSKANDTAYADGWERAAHSGYADADGREEVANWACVEGGSFATFQYVHNNVAFSAADTSSFLLDQLASLLEDLPKHSRSDSILLRSASEHYCSGRKLSEVSSVDLFDEVLCAQSLKELPDFQFDCPTCHRFCGELVRSVLVACQDGPPSLFDVLGHVHQFLSELLHSPVDQHTARPPSLDDSTQLDMQHNNLGSRTFDSVHCRETLPETPCCSSDSLSQDVSPSEPHERIRASNIFESDSLGILCCSAGKTAVVKLLCLLNFDLAYQFLLPALIIQRNEIVVNYASCPVRRLGEQSGERPISGRHGKSGSGEKCSLFDGIGSIRQATYWDKGTAARFFHNSDWSYEVAERLAGADAVRYQAKAGRKERDAGLDGMPAKIRNITEGHGRGPVNTSKGDGTGIRENRPARNPHPTVKPIALTQWLATLLLPPDAYAPRRILVPFAGSGSEAIGAMLAGWEHITLVEMSSGYCDIARARLAWWTEQADGQMWPDVKQILKNVK